MEAFVNNLNFPTSIALDNDGLVYIAESGLPFDGAPAGGSISRITAHGERICLLTGLREPVNGLSWHAGNLIISEGGYPGRISRLELASGEHHTILDNLPGFGNYHTNMAVVGPDRKLYFSQGAMTNSGVIGTDSHDLAWLGKIKHNCDIPGYDIHVGNFVSTTVHPTTADGTNTMQTGGFAPFGTVLPPGEKVQGKLPCTSAIMRCNLDGSELELVAWGIRNAFGLGFLQDGRLLATDQGADARGVRPVSHCPDFLYEIKTGAWYGWPDYYGGVPVTDVRFQGPDGKSPDFLLATHDKLPPPQASLLDFEVNSCAVKFAQIPSHFPSLVGDLIVTQFGDECPMTGPQREPVGRNLVRVSTRDWSLHALPELPLKRPIDIAFDPTAAVAYVVDFGEFEITTSKGVAARAGSGRLWKLPARYFTEGS